MNAKGGVTYLLASDNYVNQNCLITPQLNKTNLQLPLILLQNGSETSNKSKSKKQKGNSNFYVLQNMLHIFK